ncbi:unnamed protein product, partial [Adineta steineri]
KFMEIDNEENIIVPLTEQTNPVELSPTIVQRLSGIFYALLSAFLFTISVFITKQLEVELLSALIPRFLI